MTFEIPFGQARVVKDGPQEVRTLLLAMVQLRRTARRHGCQPIQGLRPRPAVHQIRQRQICGQPFAPITIPAAPASRIWSRSRARRDIGDQINKKIIAPAGQCQQTVRHAGLQRCEQARQRQGDGGSAHQPDRHIREPGARFLARTAPKATTSSGMPTNT